MNTITPSPGLRGLIATAVLSALASGFNAVAAAADGPDVPTAIVKYGDLNLSTAQGATALYGRIRSAAEIVCSSFDWPFDHKLQVLKADCVSHAIAKAVAAVNEPALFIVYKANSRTPLPTMVVSQSR